MSIHLLHSFHNTKKRSYMDNEKMIENIRSLCKTNNISPTKLEEELGFSQGLISRWKDKTPNLDRIIDIADYFEVTLDEVIGRNKADDEFLNALIKRTSNNTIVWYCYNVGYSRLPKQYFSEPCSLEDFLNEKDFLEYTNSFNETSYYCEFKNGYIILYGSYYNNNIKKPKEVKLFIQPNYDSELILQEYSTKQLLSLWLKVLFNLGDNSPDEIKAEELKNDFINDLTLADIIKM